MPLLIGLVKDQTNSRVSTDIREVSVEGQLLEPDKLGSSKLLWQINVVKKWNGIVF